MLKNEIKTLLPGEWKSMFKHRDYIDPPGYSVGIVRLIDSIDEILLVKNDNTDDIMEYFYDDISNSINLDWLIRRYEYLGRLTSDQANRNIGKYTITKDYILSRLKREVILGEVKVGIGDLYPKISFCGVNINIHKLIAEIFVPNPYPDKYNIVNHNDLSKTNFKKENLLWCDISYNNKTENRKRRTTKQRYLRKSDNKLFLSSELPQEYGIKVYSITSAISDSIKRNVPYKGSYWEIIDDTLERYLQQHPLTDRWYTHPTNSDLMANSNGVIKLNGKLTIGTECIMNGCKSFVIRINGKSQHVHRVVAECYIGRLLEDGEVIDHKIPRTEEDCDNSFENISVGNQKDNMSNEFTRRKSFRHTLVCDLLGNIVFEKDSVNEVAKYFGYKIISGLFTISHRGNTDIEERYLFGSKDEVSLKLNYVYTIWELDKDNNPVCIKANTLLKKYGVNDGKWSVSDYLNTGMPAPDGYYYQQGTPNEMIYDPDNINLIRKREEIHWILDKREYDDKDYWRKYRNKQTVK